MNEIASVRSIDDLIFGTFAEEHELVAREDLNGNMGLVPPNSLFNERTVRNDDHVDYDVFKSIVVKKMAEASGDVMKLGAHAHVFCFALHFAPEYRTRS